MDFAIYADGSGSIGYGHLHRTNALATELIDRGYNVTYLTATPDATREIVTEETTVRTVSALSELISHIELINIDALVIDSYEIDHRLQQELVAAVPRLAVIKDRHQHPVCCDVLINGNIYAPKLEYEWTGSEPTWCLGPDYLLLREDVRRFINQEPPSRDPPKNALVTMGGSDGKNITPAAVRAFDGSELEVEVIVGPGFSNHSEIEAAANEISCNVSLVDDPNDLPERMFNADLAVSALGTTVYELLATRTPFIGIQTAANQTLTADSLQERELAPIVDQTAEEIGGALDCFKDPVERVRIHEAASRLLTVHSVSNIIGKIIA